MTVEKAGTAEETAQRSAQGTVEGVEGVEDTAQDPAQRPARDSAQHTAQDPAQEPAEHTAQHIAQHTAQDPVHDPAPRRPAQRAAHPARPSAQDSSRSVQITFHIARHSARALPASVPQDLAPALTPAVARAPDLSRDPAVAPAPHVLRRTGFTIAADGSYAACLAEASVASEEGEGGGGWFAERWTLDGPEPYTVPLPGAQPEEPGTQVLPMSDGRVLIRRRVAERHDLCLLYPSGTGTGSLPLGSLTGAEVRLLPPAPAGAFALSYDGDATALWQLRGTAPVHVLTVPGRCTGGVWLDRAGRLLALDRELDGRTKAVAVDLYAGLVSPLLQLTEDSDDRLLLAEPDSGLMLLRSDATGEARIGWGVLGSRHPVRFPDVLQVRGALLTPVAAQPGQILSPEASVVAFRAEAPGGAECLALWRPGERHLNWRVSPPNWLGPTALWLPGGPLRLPYAPTGLAAYDPPPPPVRELPVPRVLRLRTAPRTAPRSAPPPARRALSVLPLQESPLTAVS